MLFKGNEERMKSVSHLLESGGCQTLQTGEDLQENFFLTIGKALFTTLKS